jgi:hypothetical protein
MPMYFNSFFDLKYFVTAPRVESDLTHLGSSFLSTGILCMSSPGRKGPAIARALEAKVPAAIIPDEIIKDLLFIMNNIS